MQGSSVRNASEIITSKPIVNKTQVEPNIYDIHKFGPKTVSNFNKPEIPNYLKPPEITHQHATDATHWERNIKGYIDEKMESLHFEMVRQFQLQHLEFKRILEDKDSRCREKDAEIKRLQEENRKLQRGKY